MHPSDVVKKYVRQGTVLSERYEIEGFIGSGAYGSIFSAIDRVTMERVAVKALPPPNQGVNATAVGRFHREMKVISSLRHANVINLYDFGETPDGIVFMVLEYVDGPTLYDLVTERRFSVDQALSVTRQIAQGLGAAHALGVVHRDLKPQNIMLIADRSGDYQVKVLDFGMAKLLQRLNDESIIQLTREGVAVGTPRYIAPEQARGREVGPYSDLYALGLLMYEMFTGARAVKADSVESAILAHVSKEPLKLEEIDQVPEIVRPLLFKLIEKNPKKRYQTAEEVIGDIRRIDQQLQGRPAAGAPRPAAPALGGAEEGRLRSINSVDELRLDYSRVERSRPNDARPAAPPSGVQALAQRVALRLPHTSNERLEALLAACFAPVAFTLASAHFYDAGYIVRWLVGAVPFLLATGVAVALRSTQWRWSIFRLWLIVGAAMFFAAHLNLPQLARGLVLDPAWYLEPFDWFPGVELLQRLIGALSRAHASILAGFSSEAATVVHRATGG